MYSYHFVVVEVSALWCSRLLDKDRLLSRLVALSEEACFPPVNLQCILRCRYDVLWNGNGAGSEWWYAVGVVLLLDVVSATAVRLFLTSRLGTKRGELP